MSDRRMPSDIPGGYNFVVRTDNYFNISPPPSPLNQVRLGIPGVDVTEWHTQRGVLDGVYLKWIDKSQKTKPINKQMVDLLDDAWEFIRPRLDIIASSVNINETDETVFNLVADANHADPTHRQVAMTEKVFGELVIIGGGTMAGHVRPSGTSKRNRIFEDADGVVIYYSVTPTPTPITDPTLVSNKVFTKGNFLLELGVPNVGKYLNYMLGWNFAPNTKFNGPIGGSQSTLIG